MIRLFTLLVSIFTLSFLTTATIIQVPNDQVTIQQGINAASTGDTVIVAEGTWYENINYNGKAITVASRFILDDDTSHISKTIIDGSQPSHPDSASVVRMLSGEDTTSVLCGFTITGGKGTYVSMEGTLFLVGGGICTLGSGGKIENNIIRQNNLPNPTKSTHAWGFGLSAMVENHHLIIRNNVFREHTFNGVKRAMGGGMCIGGGSILIEGNTIMENSITSGTESVAGGIGYWFNKVPDGVIHEVIIRNNLIKNNTLKASNLNLEGAGIFVRGNHSDKHLHIYNNVISGNRAVNKLEGGITLWEIDNAMIYNNTIVNNTGLSGGNQIALRMSSNATIFNNILWSNIGSAKEIIVENGSSAKAQFNCIRKGWTGEGNIDADPLLDYATYELLEGSPCIGLGAYSINVENVWYPAPDFDFLNLKRPNAADHWTDIGAIESEFARADDPTLIKVPEEIATIQSAIDAATNGDTVLVAEGTFYENINYNGKAITVASRFILDGDTSHISKTIIDGSQYTKTTKASVVTIKNVPNSNAVLTGLTITGGAGSIISINDNNLYAGGGILIENNGARIESNIIHNNILKNFDCAASGICAKLSKNDTLYISHNTIKDNSVISNNMPAGTIVLVAARNSTVRIFNNTVSYNKTTSPSRYKAVAGGLYIQMEYSYGADIRVYNNVIDHNELHCQSSMGGGIYVVYGTNAPTPVSPTQLRIYNNLITHNYSQDKGGGVAIWNMAKHKYTALKYPPDPVLANNTFSGNIASDGSGIFNYDAISVLINNIFWDSISETCREIFQDSIHYCFPTGASWCTDVNRGKLHLYNNAIKGGWQSGQEEAWEGTWLGENNLDTDPLLDTATFELSDNSPCIGKGIDSVEIAGSWFYAPGSDFRDSSMRPNPANTSPDIGARESNLKWPVSIPKTEHHIKRFRISPNPSSDIIKIKVSEVDHFKLRIIALNGQTVFETDMNEPEKQIDVYDLKAGLYLIRISSEDIVVTEKLIKL
ncbi:T9SS type A sorting domain-containing protein [Saccharicrinis sp. FJH54]|uniref:T9SS type A sorting domain-containing protein n=1 Tax=Saccharicrinis sp. FJH54 TaxID=3344665 RepID=UPI0035D4FD2F